VRGDEQLFREKGFERLVRTHYGILHDTSGGFIPVMLYDRRRQPAHCASTSTNWPPRPSPSCSSAERNRASNGVSENGESGAVRWP